MATLIPHALLQELRGNVDGLVIRKIRGRYFLSRKPEQDENRQPTAGEQAFRRRFRLASSWAQRVQSTPELHDFYAPFAKKRDLRVRAVAISDWFHPPVVQAIDLKGYRGRAGDRIVVRAHDEFGVKAVRLTLSGSSGRSLETGLAILHRKVWRYTTTATAPAGETITIEAIAYDRPDQKGKLAVTWPR